MIKPRYVSVGKAVGVWRDYEIDVRLEVSPGMHTVISITREEATILRDKLNRYLGDHK